MWTQLRKINLELLRLTAYYAPICPGLSTVKDSYCNTICPAEDVSSIMKTIAYMCTFSRRLDAVEFDVLLKALCDVDEDSATLLIAGMNQVVTPTKIILNNNT